jgi:hypothetical protein
MGWTIAQWAGLGVRPDGEPMSAEEMAGYGDDEEVEDSMECAACQGNPTIGYADSDGNSGIGICRDCDGTGETE